MRAKYWKKHWRLTCFVHGCRWSVVAFLPENTPKFNRVLWTCVRCGDYRKVSEMYGFPDHFYRDYNPDPDY